MKNPKWKEPYIPDLQSIDRYPTYEPELPPQSVMQFNTGLMYTDEGQIIVALLIDYGRVIFNDTSRRVDGLIQLTEGEQRYYNRPPEGDVPYRRENVIHLIQAVISHYSEGDYQAIPYILRPFLPARDNDRLTYLVVK